MKKSMVILIALVVTSSMMLAGCGSPGAAQPTVKNVAVATMDAGEMPIEVKVDVSTGLSVQFDSDGFCLFQGEFDDSTYPLATATILSEEVYEKYLEDNKDNESLKEEYGIYTYTSTGAEEFTYLYKIGEKVPFMISFEKGIDQDKADEITKCLEFDY